ncbi:hypothetical protein [Lysinibacillus pakistanensis]|uniref:hypothetical protein n=1 Tax=Lysinibacillus pakistanensis TaxID=759811 RepID=UPI003D26C243
MWVSQQEEWEKWTHALAFEQKQYKSLDITNPIEEIERITGESSISLNLLSGMSN